MAGLELRPGFPNDLRVLLVDKCLTATKEATAMLEKCGYTSNHKDCSAEAALELSAAGSEYDVVLIDVGCLSSDDCTPEHSAAILRSGLPVVLMGTGCDPSKALHGIMEGAVDLLEKPLSITKVATIWTHQVRRQLAAAAAAAASAAASMPPASAEWQFEDDFITDDPGANMLRVASGTGHATDAADTEAGAEAGMPTDHDAPEHHSAASHSGMEGNQGGCGTHDGSAGGQGRSPQGVGSASAGTSGGQGGAGAESASVASTSEALRGVMVDLLGSQDLDATSFGAGSARPLLNRLDSSQVAGLASGLSHLTVMAEDLSGLGFTLDMGAGDQLPATSPAAANSTQRTSSSMGLRRAYSAIEPSPTDDGTTNSQRPQRQHRPASRQPLQHQPDQQQPHQLVMAVGHAAGRLPDILESHGMAWGLPTTPLHISPRVPPFPHMGPFSPGPALGGMGGLHAGMMLPGMPTMGLPPGMGMGAGMAGMGLGMGLGPGFMPNMFLGNMPSIATPPPGMCNMGSPGMFMGAHDAHGTMGMQQLPNGFPVSPTTCNNDLNDLHVVGLANGMIPTPLPASGSPGLPPPAPPSTPAPARARSKGSGGSNPATGIPTSPRSARVRKTSANTAPKRAISMPLPPQHVVESYMETNNTMAAHMASQGMLLDPLAVLDEPMDGYDPLDPLDPLLMDGHGVGAMVAAGLCGNGRGNGENGHDNGNCANGASKGADSSDLDDWLMADPEGNGHVICHMGQGNSQPLGLTLHKTASLADMIMASLDNGGSAQLGYAVGVAGDEATDTRQQLQELQQQSGEQQQQQQQQQAAVAKAAKASAAKASATGTRTSTRARRAPAAH